MDVIFTAGRELAYPRNSQIVSALEKQYQVRLITDRASHLTVRLVKVGWRLLWQRFVTDSVCFVGFYGQPLVFPLRIHWQGPLILDAFVSTYDTYCFDRQVFRPNSILGQLAFHLDRVSCQLADKVVVDTLAQAEYFERTFGISRSKIHVLYVGCDDQLFSPRDALIQDTATILFYGTFLPLHGVDIILRAAQLLIGEPARFVLVGRGQEYQRARAMAEKLKTPNVEFLAPVPLEALPEIIAQATICLGGHFGASEKAKRVIAGKTFQCLAMGKPTVVGDNPANRELFTHGENVWMCPMADPKALAEAIRYLLAAPHLRARLGERGRDTVQSTSGNRATAEAVQVIIEKAISTRQSASPSTDSYAR